MSIEETKAREEIYDAVRFLPPRVAQQLLEDISKDLKKVIEKYERELEYSICS